MAQLNLKKVIARLLQWVQYPLIKNNVANTNTFYRAHRTDTDTLVSFGVGSGGVSHGVYSNTLGKWLIHGDASKTYVNNNIPMEWTTITVTKSGSAWTAGTIYAWCTAGTVTVSFSNVSIGTISARTTIATIPAGYRPRVEQYGMYTTTSLGWFSVGSNGNIQVNGSASGKTGLYACVTYAIWQ